MGCTFVRSPAPFFAVAELGRVLGGLTGTKFDIIFVQDRDGMPDFLVTPFLKSQEAEGVEAYLLERHEIENHLLEPALFTKAATLAGKMVTNEIAASAIIAAAQDLKAEAMRASLECAKLVNRHLSQARLKDDELELQVFKWFDGLKLDSLDTVQRVFPGKELLPKALEKVNGGEKKITRGNLVASLTADLVRTDIREFLRRAAEGKPKKR
jgi:hypothetical protein